MRYSLVLATLSAACVVPLDGVETGSGSGGGGATTDGGSASGGSSTGGGGSGGAVAAGGMGGMGGGAMGGTGGTAGTLTYSEAVLADGPIGYWRFGEAPGETKAIDIVGGFDGTYAADQPLGVQGLIAGDSDTAVRLDHCDHGDIRMGYTVASFAPDAPFTLEVWIRPDFVDDLSRTIVDRFTVSPDQGFRLVERLNRIYLSRCDEGTCTVAQSDPSVVFTLTTAYVVATYENGESCISVNGAPRACTGSQGSISHTTAVQFGVSIVGSCYAGVIDELAVYAKVLSDEQIQTHYALGSGS